MSLTLSKKTSSKTRAPFSQRADKSAVGTVNRPLRFIRGSALRSWEIYLILLVAGFLRLYQLNRSEFDADQAAIFSIAREAIHSGLLPMVSNRASIGIENPPAVIYLLMLPASLSADPLWATVMIGLFNTLAVLLTYLFTRRYYGRLAGTVAALLYASAAKPLNFSRFIWQQNMLAPFVVLFLFALFWGVVERRRGWLAPALFLLGILYQLHETSFLLALLVPIAFVLAPGTVRWRDAALGLASLLLLFSTYILWEVSARFVDVQTLLSVAKLHAHIDGAALFNYRLLLSPNGFGEYDQLPSNPNSALYLFTPLLAPLRYLLLFLLAAGFATAALLVFWPRRLSLPLASTSRPANSSAQAGYSPLLQHVRTGWTNLCTTPYRCGLLLLLAWQIILLLLSRHTVILHSYYLLILLPGPFILIGLFSAVVAVLLGARIPRITAMLPVQLIRQQFARLGVSRSLEESDTSTSSQQRTTHKQSLPKKPALHIAGLLRSGLYLLLTCLILAQVITCTASLLDNVNAAGGHGHTYNDIISLQQALAEADQLAQQHHLNRVYISIDASTALALPYLAQQMRTPTTLFDATHCLLLPQPASGPAVLLLSPFAQLPLALLSQEATATLIAQPARSGSQPFQLYIVEPPANPTLTSVQASFVNDLQPLALQQLTLGQNATPELISRWSLLRSAQPASRVTYNYVFSAHILGNQSSSTSLCTFTALRSSDQLFVAFDLPSGSSVPSGGTSVTIQGQFYTRTPYNPSFGPLHMQTDQTQDSAIRTLHTPEGQDTLTLALP